MSDKILAFIDEFKIESVTEENVLKNLITGNTQRKRAMYADPTYVESYLNLAIASNHWEKFFPASEKARRYEAFTSSAEELLDHPWMKQQYQGDMKKYFEGLVALMLDNDWAGLKTFANFLYNVPLGSFDYRKTAITRLLVTQKLNGLNPVQTWWVNLLSKKANFDVNKSESQRTRWPELKQWWDELELISLRSSYLAYSKEIDKEKVKRFARIDTELDLWTYLHQVLPPQCELKENVTGYGANQQKVKVLHFCDWEICVKHICTQIEGLELYFEAIENNTTLNTSKRNRIAKLSTEELIMDFIPENFFGYPLRQKMENGTFEVKGNDRWVPIDREASATKHSAKDLTGLFKSYEEMEKQFKAKRQQEKQKMQKEARQRRAERYRQENEADRIQQEARHARNQEDQEYLAGLSDTEREEVLSKRREKKSREFLADGYQLGEFEIQDEDLIGMSDSD